MLRLIITFLLCVSALFAQNNVSPIKLDQAASSKWKYDITDPLLAFEPMDVANYKDSLIFLTDGYSKKIYKIDVKSKKFTELSRAGSGPGEYRFPMNLAVFEKTLYFADYVTGLMQALDFNGRYVLNLNSKTRAEAWGPFAMLNKQKAFIGQIAGSRAVYWVYDTDGKPYIKNENCFLKIPMPTLGGSIFIYQSMAYYINPFEFIIHCFDTGNGADKLIELKGLERIFQWKSYYSGTIGKKEYEDILENRWRLKPVRIFKVVKNSKLFFGISYYNSSSKTYFCAFFNNAGECLLNIDLGYLAVSDIDNNILRLYNNKDRELKGFYFYSIKKEIWDKVK